jgi:histidinol-phosphatase
VPEPSLKDLLNVAVDAAYLGGRKTLSYFNAGVAVETKSDNTPVTCADRESEELIRARIAKYFPTHAIIGEEHAPKDGDAAYRWIIDPIDGTKTFIHGVPFYGVLIGVEVRGVPAVGAVYLPALDEMICAASGLGCQWNGRSARVSSTAELKDAVLLVTDTESARKKSGAFEKLSARTKFTRTWGDCYGYVLVATGRADIMVDPHMNPWDCAPLLPILQEAGGHFTDWQGTPTIWGKDALGANAALHAQALAILRGEA